MIGKVVFKTRESEVKKRFVKDVANHVMTVIKDDGVYRHIRFSKPDCWSYGFYVVTWPGFLAVTGDMGEYMFSRVEDMFKFFRKEESDAISVGYWAEKCLARGREGIEEYSRDTFIENVWSSAHQWFDSDDGEIPTDAYKAIKKDVISAADSGEHEAMKAAMEFEWKGEYPFQDFWESDSKQYTHQFLWCLHAIPWAIAKYDAAKKEGGDGAS